MKGPSCRWSRRVLVSLAALSLGGCKVNMEDKGAGADRDVAKLEKIVQLPIRPLEVWFRSVPRGNTAGGIGPTDWTFLAVMRFDPQTLDAFVKSGQLVEKPDPRFPRKEVVPWFPGPVTAAFHPASETHMRVKGRRFDATPFARGASAAGSFFVLDDAPYVILRRPQE